jgi:hypothetical protein
MSGLDDAVFINPDDAGTATLLWEICDKFSRLKDERERL